MARYKLVSQVKYHGQPVDIPDGARNVSVQPLAHGGGARVTYLKPVVEVAVGEPAPRPARARPYVG